MEHQGLKKTNIPFPNPHLQPHHALPHKSIPGLSNNTGLSLNPGLTVPYAPSH